MPDMYFTQDDLTLWLLDRSTYKLKRHGLDYKDLVKAGPMCVVNKIFYLFTICLYDIPTFNQFHLKLMEYSFETNKPDEIVEPNQRCSEIAE